MRHLIINMNYNSTFWMVTIGCAIPFILSLFLFGRYVIKDNFKQCSPFLIAFLGFGFLGGVQVRNTSDNIMMKQALERLKPTWNTWIQQKRIPNMPIQKNKVVGDYIEITLTNNEKLKVPFQEISTNKKLLTFTFYKC